MCRMSGLDCLLGRANNMTKVNTMNLQRVTGKAFYAECQECHRRLLFGEQGHGDTSNCKGWADLDGEPFKAYYCEDCVKGKPEIPSGMISVTQEQFYAALYADKRDIMPTTKYPYYTTWEVVRTRSMWGWSYPGWKNAGEHAKVYAIYPSALTAG
jgi:hypothetical protein